MYHVYYVDQEFDFDMEYTKGNKNTVANAPMQTSYDKCIPYAFPFLSLSLIDEIEIYYTKK